MVGIRSRSRCRRLKPEGESGPGEPRFKSTMARAGDSRSAIAKASRPLAASRIENRSSASSSRTKARALALSSTSRRVIGRASDEDGVWAAGNSSMNRCRAFRAFSTADGSDSRESAEDPDRSQSRARCWQVSANEVAPVLSAAPLSACNRFWAFSRSCRWQHRSSSCKRSGVVLRKL